MKELLPYFVSGKASWYRQSTGVVHRCVQRLLGPVFVVEPRPQAEKPKAKRTSSTATTIVLRPSGRAA